MKKNSHQMDKSPVLEKVRQTIFRYSMIEKGDGIVVGVSGGMDSMCLLHLLCCLQKDWDLQLIVAHLHHGLRGKEADGEYAFVENLAKQWELPFEGQKIRPQAYGDHSNIQARARELRYRFYDEISDKWSARKVALGHHQDDHVETLLLQMFRGTGTLKGIPPIRNNRVIRPLFNLRRKDISCFVEQQRIPYCEDSSNQKKTYLRNRIRLEFVPWIQKEMNPSFADSLIHLSSISLEENDCIEAIIQEKWRSLEQPFSSDRTLAFKRTLFEQMPRALQRRLLRKAYQKLVGTTFGLTFAQLDNICERVANNKKPHIMFFLPQGCRLYLEYQDIYLSKIDLWQKKPYHYPVLLGDRISIQEAGIVFFARSLTTNEPLPQIDKDRFKVYMDGGYKTEKIVLRNYRNGDRFYPLGAGGEKKLKDFFIDQKIPRSLRPKIPILEIGGQIAWVGGCRIDERFKLTSDTIDIMVMQILPDLNSDSSVYHRLSRH